jgi:hypothetical protein
LKDVSVFFAVLVTFSCLNLSPDHVDQGHTPIEWEAEEYYLRVSERVE